MFLQEAQILPRLEAAVAAVAAAVAVVVEVVVEVVEVEVVAATDAQK